MRRGHRAGPPSGAGAFGGVETLISLTPVGAPSSFQRFSGAGRHGPPDLFGTQNVEE